MLNVMQTPDSIIVAGGGAVRLGGIDKAMLPLAESSQSLLQGVINACPGHVIVVGPQRELTGVSQWVPDDIADAGPAAALWSALPFVTSDYVFISAGDQVVSQEAVRQICAAAEGHDGAWALRPDGSGQPLCACVHTQTLRRLLEPTQGVNQSPLRLLAAASMVGVTIQPHDLFDVDTWQDVAQLVRRSAMDQTTHMWLKRVADVLNVEQHDIPVDALLELTRDVAHGVERKSAPLTTYLLGFAAGSGHLTPDQVSELIIHLKNAVSEWNSSDQ